jgi:hypothetical protein
MKRGGKNLSGGGIPLVAKLGIAPRGLVGKVWSFGISGYGVV